MYRLVYVRNDLLRVEDPEKKRASLPSFNSVQNQFNSSHSIEFELVEHVWRVLGTSFSTVHILGIIPLYTTLLVSPEGISSQVRVFVVQIFLCLIRLL